MYKLILGMIPLAVLLVSSCNNSHGSFIQNAHSEESCNAKNGYWYKDKCWNDFEDEGISIADIDQFVTEEMAIVEKARVSLNGQDYPIRLFLALPEGDELLFLTVFEDDIGIKSVIQTVPMNQIEGKDHFSSEAMILAGDVTSEGEEEPALVALGILDATGITEEGEGDMQFEGQLSNESGETYLLSILANEATSGAGDSRVEVRGEEAFVNGTLGTRTYQQLKDVITEHPEVKTIILGQVSGSVNDAVNMHTGRIVHEAGLTTKVQSTSDIASGGVDLFCAGVERIVEQGAKIGIHSWCCVDDLTAIEIPRDHPAHQYQLEYFSMILGSEQGPAFYFHTLEAAPFDGVHYMSDAEIVEWKVATDFINSN